MQTAWGLALLMSAASACGPRQDDSATAAVVGGHYVWGAEVNVFSPCGSGLEYWVDAAPPILHTLREQYAALGLPPYQAVFIEVRGEIGPVLDCGFCEDYDGSFQVEELIQMRSPGPEECLTEIDRTHTENGA